MKLPQIIHIFKYNWNFLDQLLLPYKFYSRDMYGMYVFIFASGETLKQGLPGRVLKLPAPVPKWMHISRAY